MLQLALELAVGPVLWLRLADGRLNNGLALLDYWCGRCSEVPLAQRVRVGMARAWLFAASGDLTRAQRVWRARSRLGVRPDIDAFCLQVEAVIGLSHAVRGDHAALPGVVRAAESLRGTPLPWAYAFGYAVSAAVASIEGEPWQPTADAAVDALDQADAHLLATLLRRRIVQASGQSSLAQDHKLVQLGVSDPEAMLNRVLPGLPATAPTDR